MAMNALRKGCGSQPGTVAPPRLMTPDEARSIRSSLISFGSHGLTHADLPGLSSEAKMREIGGSVAACQAITGEKPRSYAYAYGEFDRESERLVEECRFECACATGHRLVSQTDSPFALPRIHVWNRDSIWLRRQLASPAP
jgi:peptidoglycan/xylan/chitin deacetylase (PgdA/CDA1 family)